MDIQDYSELSKINVYLNLCWPWENLTKRVIQLLGNSSQKRYLLHQKSSMVIVSSKKKGISLELENPGKIHDLSHFDSTPEIPNWISDDDQIDDLSST